MQLPRTAAPVNLWLGAKPKRRLEVNVYGAWAGIRQRDHIDIVLRLARFWLDGRWLNEAWKAFAIALHCWIDPVGHGNRWSSLNKMVSIALQWDLGMLYQLTYGKRVSTSLASIFLNGGAASVATNKAPRSAEVAVALIVMNNEKRRSRNKPYHHRPNDRPAQKPRRKRSNLYPKTSPPRGLCLPRPCFSIHSTFQKMSKLAAVANEPTCTPKHVLATLPAIGMACISLRPTAR